MLLKLFYLENVGNIFRWTWNK